MRRRCPTPMRRCSRCPPQARRNGISRIPAGFSKCLALLPALPDYSVFDPSYTYLFNSYYESIGARYPSGRRGRLTTGRRWTKFLPIGPMSTTPSNCCCSGRLTRDVAKTIELGCHHEQQHQELLLTDILHLFAQNPLRPVYRSPGARGQRAQRRRRRSPIPDIRRRHHRDRRRDEGFAFDCERPRHRIFIDAFRLANRPVINAEWMDFIEDGGYRIPCCGCRTDGRNVAPRNGRRRFIGRARRRLLGDDAFGTAAASIRPRRSFTSAISRLTPSPAGRNGGCRLKPNGSARRVGVPVRRKFRRAGPDASDLRAGGRRPACSSCSGMSGNGPAAPFLPYPRFRPSAGAASEYNGKFMCGQFVLRGGSCATPASHMRASYRNFFPPGRPLAVFRSAPGRRRR